MVKAYYAVAKGEVEEDLVIVGRFGWKIPFLKAVKKTDARGARIHLPGHVPDEDLPALYAAARALVWPSLYEGFGLPVAEAMACGAAVLTSNTSALPEVAGDAALLVDPANQGAIEEGLCRLSQDDALVASLCARGPNQAAKFTWEAAARATFASYCVAAQSR